MAPGAAQETHIVYGYLTMRKDHHGWTRPQNEFEHNCGDNMWGHTKNAWGYSKTAANFVVSPVTKLLRSAPSQDYVFESVAVSQQRVKTAFFNDGKPLASQVQARGLVIPQRYQSVYGNPPVTPQRVVEAAPAAALSAPRTIDDISFVKMGGGSNMQDWVMCASVHFC